MGYKFGLEFGIHWLYFISHSDVIDHKWNNFKYIPFGAASQINPEISVRN